MQSTDSRNCMSYCGFMLTSLKNHALPKGRIEIPSKLWSAVHDEKLQALLFLLIAAPFYAR